ncbi:penicillin-binding protein 1C [Glaesserella sp.]|uniref:penicillin-binding protein 1C n=1 Tax=Glaesserella sp. TaxID=2094731 RepID=UPI00359FE82D
MPIWFKKISRWTGYILLFCLCLALVVRFLPHPPLKARFTYSTAIYDDQNQLIRLTTAEDERYRLWTPLNQISPELIDAVLLQEDQWFYWHWGVNPYGLVRGAVQTYLLGNSPQGGSTLTMQLARILWQIDSRSIGGKLEQILRAVQLEMQYSKEDILEAYFNFAPYGRNIEGAGTASLIYFNKANRQLNLAEAMTLAILPKNPSAYIRQNNQQLNPALWQARNQLYQRWLTAHPEDKQWQSDFQLSYPLRPLEKLPFIAPHFTDQMLSQYPEKGEIKTTLNSQMQRLVERATQRYLAQLGQKGIENAAVLLVNHRTMEVKALVGSGNYLNRTISGQINGTAVKRSYGSTLKPFIYALAFEQGLAHSKTVLKDLPTTFNDYSPENYEGNFLGPIPLEQALIQSRNIPAIEMASKLRSPDLYDLLQQAQMYLPKSKAYYGLSLVLGGAELSVQQLSTLYAMLANQGGWQPLKWLQNSPTIFTKQLLSRESAVMISNILAKTPRTDVYNKSLITRLPLYWKTGTSNGLRDAWTVGYFGDFTLVVWFGNFNNKSNPHFIGRSLATPLFLQIADNVIAQNPKMADILRDADLNLKSIEVCAADGNLPNVYCQQRVKTDFIPGKSPIKISHIYQAFQVEKESDLLACPPYNSQLSEQKIYEIWSSDFEKIFAQAGIIKRKPIVNPQCPYLQQNQSLQLLADQQLKITSPQGHREYILARNNSDKIPLTATTTSDVNTLYWFVNNSYLGASSPLQPLLWEPKTSGQYQLSVTDEKGRSGSMIVLIKVRN